MSLEATMNTPRILIVDDDNSTAKLMKIILTSNGYTVIDIASSGEDAIEKALSSRPDLIIMNIRLRGKIDGIAACEQIRTVNDIPLLFVSGYADTNTIARAEQHNPCGYITKPFLKQELLRMVEKALKTIMPESD
jgi:CheY-like chemotaxis protein